MNNTKAILKGIKTILIGIAIISVLFMLTGCKAPTKDYPITDKDFKKGTDGISLEFIQNGPPATVMEESSFQIIARVHNKGAYNASNVYITANLERDYMCITEKNVGNTEKDPCPTSNANTTQNKGPMNGRSIYNPSGDLEETIFNAYARKIDAMSKKHTSTVAVTACYEYMTEITDDVCIEPDIYGTGTLNKVCTPKDLTYSGQGAPVIIDKIETKMLPVGADKVKPQFIIHIVNKGSGTVIGVDKAKEACSSSSIVRKDWNSAILSIMQMSKFNYTYNYKANTEEGAFECKLQPIRLDSITKDGEIKCTLKEEYAINKTDPAYKAQLFIRLRYGYTFSMSKNVVIEKPLTY